MALLLSALALVLSLLTLVYSRASRRRDLFLDMHERLLDREIRDGRRALLEASVCSVNDARRFRERDEEGYRLACRALAMCDVLGLYVRKRFISKRLVLDEWGHTYAALWECGQHIISMRLADDGDDVGHRWSAWQNFQRLGADATEWVGTQPARA